MADGEIPTAWAGAPVILVDDAAVANPATCVAELHEAWAARRPVVVALAVDPARFREPESWAVEPWTLGPGFDAYLDRLHFLVWANNYDARADGEPVWWWARKAARLGARAASPNEAGTPAGQATSSSPTGGRRGSTAAPAAPSPPPATRPSSTSSR